MRSPVDYRRIAHAMAAGPAAAGELYEAAALALTEIAAGRRSLRAVRHPLGFLCLPVEREADRGVCVHVFDDDARRAAPALTTSPVHAHSWDLASCVLYGEVGNVRALVREDAHDPTHRLYEVHSTAPAAVGAPAWNDTPAVDEIRPTTRLVRCTSDPQETSTAGEVYRLAAGQFHATVVPDGTRAATLLLGRTRPGGADLTVGPVHGTTHRVVRQTCDAATTARTARTVLRRIHGHHGG
ncbi:hypothetical protein [Streptomyces sp. NPDC049555]|uniref:hypothetical protein n=1 Tax=Streptomyces sp. NPDC049555 TaxID=3154930 RepID=UPI0034169071